MTVKKALVLSSTAGCVIEQLQPGDTLALTSASITDFDTQVRTSRLDQMAMAAANVNFGGQAITNAAGITTGGTVTIGSGGKITTDLFAGFAYTLCAYDVDGGAHTPFITFTANNTPTCNLSTAVTIGGAAIASQAFVSTSYAPLASPPLTGVPTAPTAAGTANTTQIATTAMVQAALAAYIAAQDVLVFKGVIDCSANPNYPAADAGHVYKVSVAGKIGGASGPNVEVGDVLTCTTDSSASGNHATVGTNWIISQVNIDGAVTGPTSAVDGRVVLFNGTTGKIIKDSGLTLSGANTGDQTITLTGNVTGSGTGSFATTIAAGSVTEAMQVLADNTTNDVGPTKHGYAPKGDGSTTKFLNANGAYSTPASGTMNYIVLRDEKAQNTGGGSFTSGAWRTRVLNTEASDTGNDCSLSSNQITLAAGTYRCRIRCPAYTVNRHQARLFNVTDTALVLLGSSEIALSTTNGYNDSEIMGRFTIAASKALEVQHQCQTTFNTQGFGVEANFGTEVYTVAEFWKE